MSDKVTTVVVTTTPAWILRSCVELATPGPADETRWEKQARTLDELGYAIVGKDNAAELERLRAEIEVRDELFRRLADADDPCLCEDCVALKLQKIRDGE